jgi:DNA-binding CsgD family transcriptional regulator
MRAFVETEFPPLLDLLYDAALDASRWQQFLDALSSAFGGATGIIHVYDDNPKILPVSTSFGHDPVFEHSYGSYYRQVNPYLSIAFGKMHVGEIVRASDYKPAEGVHKTEFFNDWMKPQGITADHFAVSLLSSGGLAILSVAPHASVMGKNRDRYAAQLRMLAPHMVRAIEINRITSAGRLAEQTLNGAIDALGVAAFLVGRSGELMLANDQAESLMREERLLSVDRFRILRASRADDDRALSAAIAACIIDPWDRAPRVLRLTAGPARPDYIVWFVPVRPPRRDHPSRRYTLFPEARADNTVLVMVTRADANIDIPAEVIQAVFTLSTGEARLASALVRGQTMKQFAEDTGLSPNTVRNQLASVFLKTGIQRQADLVALIVGTLGSGPTRPRRPA